MGGTISSTGQYTASLTPGTYHVVVTSHADASKKATATVTVVNLILSPAAQFLRAGSTGSFTANLPVTWAVQEGAAGGSITAAGPAYPGWSTAAYTAPTNNGTYHVIAAAVQDTNNRVTATVTVVSSGFTAAGHLVAERAGHTATLLPDGKILIVAGGQEDFASGLVVPTGAAEIFDPGTETSSLTKSQPQVTREWHTATLLPNTKVLITGGKADVHWLSPTASTELYDPATGQFEPGGAMSTARANHTATLLANGRVLIVGGTTIDNTAVASAEIYDPVAATFTATGSMAAPRSGHTATLLPNGEVLIAGGSNLATTELYDPNSGTFTASGSMTAARTYHTATLLANGKVLMTGGWIAPSQWPSAGLATAELYDPVTGSFSTTATMGAGRLNHTATVLSDGRVLIAGGEGKDCLLEPYAAYDCGSASVEIYDPLTASFSPTGGLREGRYWHTATLLPDGSVLVTGGANVDYILWTAERYR